MIFQEPQATLGSDRIKVFFSTGVTGLHFVTTGFQKSKETC